VSRVDQLVQLGEDLLPLDLDHAAPRIGIRESCTRRSLPAAPRGPGPRDGRLGAGGVSGVNTKQGGARTAGIQVIQRAASILRALREADDGLSLAQIAEQVGLPRSTVQRIVAALQLEGWVAPASPNAGVRIGPGFAEFAVAAEKSDHTRTIHPLLVRLSRELQETVDLAVLEDDHVLFVDQVAAAQRLRAVSSVGATFPAHCTANGKVLLAALAPARARDLLPETLLRLTPRTTATRDDLLKELDEVRTTGIGFDREEHATGLCAVARAVTAPDGWTAAVTVPLPAQRFYGNERVLVAVLVAACAEIETMLNA
jgi:DNA-binding IclR family transcriptional regulator